MGNQPQNETPKKNSKKLNAQAYHGAAHGQRHGVSGSLEVGWAEESAKHMQRKQQAQASGSKFSN